MTQHIWFHVQTMPSGDFCAVGHIGNKEVPIACVSKHLYAVQAGKRWAKREKMRRAVAR